jgi:hypothetical protein
MLASKAAKRFAHSSPLQLSSSGGAEPAGHQPIEAFCKGRRIIGNLPIEDLRLIE